MGCNEAWVAQSVTKSGLLVKNRSIQNEGWGMICVGTDATWWRPNILVRESVWFPSTDNMSSDNHECDLALKHQSSLWKGD